MGSGSRDGAGAPKEKQAGANYTKKCPHCASRNLKTQSALFDPLTGEFAAAVHCLKCLRLFTVKGKGTEARQA